MEVIRGYVGVGNRWMVDLDMEKCFDQFIHDVLMVLVAKRVVDKRLRNMQILIVSGIANRTPESTAITGTIKPSFRPRSDNGAFSG